MKAATSKNAAKILTRKVPTTQKDSSVSDVLNYIKKNSPNFDSINYTYVLSKTGKLLGVVAIKSILKAKDQQTIKEIMTPKPVSVHPHTDQEKSAAIAIRYNIKAVPVIDKNNTFLGIITTDQILNILQEEHIEDILKISGIDVHLLEDPREKHPLKTKLKTRFPWLSIGLSGGIITTYIISLFSKTLKYSISVAFFIPTIIYLSGAIANQTLSMIIRNLLLSRFHVKHFLIQELSSGIILGTIFGIMLGLFSWAWIGSSSLAVVIILSMVINAFLTTLISIIVPVTLTKLNKDPALAAGPSSIVIQDFISLSIYLIIAQAILG